MTHEFDYEVGTKVLVMFDGNTVKGEVIYHWRHTSKAQFMVEFQPAQPGTIYAQMYSRKTGKQYGGSIDEKIRKSRILGLDS